MQRALARARSVPHVRQSFNWDCGLACTEMALRALGMRSEDCGLRFLRRLCPSESIWTVDLAYVLHSFGVRCRYLTTQLEVDPAYKEKSFYSATFDTDTVRVNDLFAQAEGRGVKIEQGSVSEAELVSLLGPRNHLVMALVDRRFLYASKPATVSAFVESCFQHLTCRLGPSGYLGHYVLLLEHDAERGGYYIADPGRATGRGFVHAADLEAARTAHGTDEDILLIPWQQPPLARPEPRQVAARDEGGAARSTGPAGGASAAAAG